MQNYVTNPQRGCGTKKDNSCYAEGLGFSSDGALWNFVWALGDGLKINLPIKAAAKGMTFFNPAATLAAEELVYADHEFKPQTDIIAERYERLKRATPTIGLLDHVGKSYYSVDSFVSEVREYGPSRKIPKRLARTIAKVQMKIGPIPIFFTHSEIPIFRSVSEQGKIIDITDRCIDSVNWDSKNYEPTWYHERWGQYARSDNYTGSDSYLCTILSALGGIRDLGETSPQPYRELKAAMKETRIVEQIFGASWIGRITYTSNADGTIDPDVEDIPGLNIVNLHKENQNE